MQRRLTRGGGFSFVEIMTTVAVLSFGIVLIFKAFFISLTALTHLTCRLHAINMLHNTLVNMQSVFEREKKIIFNDKSRLGKLAFGNRTIEFYRDISLRNIEKLDDIFELTASVKWNEGGKEYTLSRSAYVAYYGIK